MEHSGSDKQDTNEQELDTVEKQKLRNRALAILNNHYNEFGFIQTTLFENGELKVISSKLHEGPKHFIELFLLLKFEGQNYQI